jgi:2-methylisocitrate lyase-like PEP mutase family enzyme
MKLRKGACVTLLSVMDFPSVEAKRAEFRRLHQSGCFVIPNPWDAGSARYLQHLGFPALATTSAGVAFSRALPDTDWAVPLETMLEHIAEISALVEVPVNADFESGYAHHPEGVAENVRRCIATRVAGLSIEDATGERDKPLYELPAAVARICAARSAIDGAGGGVLLTGRAECFLVGHPDPLRESLRRLEAYAAAGADVLYAPGLRTREEIQAAVASVSPKPLNVLMGANTGLRVGDLADMGVRRISTGSALARASWGGFLRAARAMAVEGSFAGLDGAEPYTELNAFFREDRNRRMK